MNELTTFTNSLQQVSENVRNNAKQIYMVCRTIAPRFYKHTTEEMNAHLTSIQLLIRNIPEDILAIMCQMAIEYYPRARSKDPKCFFDINYILEFYDEAWIKAKKDGDFTQLIGFVDDGQVACWVRDEDYDFVSDEVRAGATVFYEPMPAPRKRAVTIGS